MWNSNTILSILQNEKYVGDVLLQKYYTPDFLSHRSVRNKGALPSYYIRDHHPAIVSRELWEQAQQERKRRSAKRKEGKKLKQDYILTGKLYCGRCGSAYIHVTRSFRRKSGTIKIGYWGCRNEVKRKAGENEKCHAARLTEAAVHQSLMEQFYRWKRELQMEGENTWLEREFSGICSRMEQENSRSGEKEPVSGKRVQILKERIEELGRNLAEIPGEQTEARSFCLEMRASLEKRLARAAEQELATNLETEDPLYEKKQEFQKFREFLEKLPEITAAGEECRQESTVDQVFLPFAQEAGNFLVRGVVEEDGTINYEMSFGIKAAVPGNRRTCKDFFGWRCGTETGLESMRNLEQVLQAVVNFQ